MKKMILALGLCIVSLLLVSCVGQGKLIIADFDYAKDYNLINYGRQVEFTIILKNIGDRNCLVTGAESLNFWNVADPGLSGRYKQHLNVIVPPGKDYVLKLYPYLRDGDILSSNEKRFELNLNVADGCVLDSSKLTGTLKIDIENPQLRPDENTAGVVVEENLQ